MDIQASQTFAKEIAENTARLINKGENIGFLYAFRDLARHVANDRVLIIGDGNANSLLSNIIQERLKNGPNGMENDPSFFGQEKKNYKIFGYSYRGASSLDLVDDAQGNFGTQELLKIEASLGNRQLHVPFGGQNHEDHRPIGYRKNVFNEEYFMVICFLGSVDNIHDPKNAKDNINNFLSKIKSKYKFLIPPVPLKNDSVLENYANGYNDLFANRRTTRKEKANAGSLRKLWDSFYNNNYKFFDSKNISMINVHKFFNLKEFAKTGIKDVKDPSALLSSNVTVDDPVLANILSWYILNNIYKIVGAKEKEKDKKDPESKKDEKKPGVPDSGGSSGAASSADAASGAAEARKAVQQAKIATANKLRLNEQAALMLNADYLITTKSQTKLGIRPRNELKYSNFVVSRNNDITDTQTNTGGGHLDITSLLLKNDFTKYFLKDIPGHILSSLTPTVKLYKVFYPDKTGKFPNAPGYSWRVPFDDTPFEFTREGDTDPVTSFIQRKSLDELIQGTGRMHSIGIKSFNYKYVGTNPAEVNTNIQAELQLYFQDVSDIVRTVRITGDSPNFMPPLVDKLDKNKFNSQDIQFCYADLIADQPREEKNNGVYRYNEKYFRIKVIVGYSAPPDHVLAQICKDSAEVNHIKNTIEANKVALFLTPVNHDLTFDENGSITLKIKYQAAVTSILADINALEIAKSAYEGKKNLDLKLKETYEKLKEIKKSESASQDYKKSKEYADFIKAKQSISNFEVELENKKNTIYSEIFSRLVGLTKASENDQQLVYSADFSKEALGVDSGGNLQSAKQSAYTPAILASARSVNNFKVSSWEGEQGLDVAPPIKLDNLILDDPYENFEQLPSDIYITVQTDEGLKTAGIKDIDDSIISQVNSVIDKKNKIISTVKAKVDPNLQTETIKKPEIKTEKKTRNVTNAKGEPKKDRKGKNVTEEYSVKDHSALFDSIASLDLVLAYKEPEKQLKLYLRPGFSQPAPKIAINDAARKAQQKKLEEITTKTRQSAKTKEGNFTVKFVYLGDIFDIFCELIHEKDRISDPIDRPRMLLTDFYLNIPVSVKDKRMIYRTFNINFADIPISVEMLKGFLLEKFIKPRISSFSLVRLLLSIITDIVAPAVSPSYFGDKAVFNKAIRASTLTLCLPAEEKDNISTDPLIHEPVEQPFGNKILNQNMFSEINRKLYEKIGSSKLLNYMIIYCSNQLPNVIKKNKGNFKDDELTGVYHFFVGANKGCLRKINFSRTDTPFYAEAKMTSSQGNKNINLRLREVFNATIEMFGNNIYRPGDFIYIEPLFYIGQKAIDLQTKIGLGGYYMVIDVDSRINDGGFISILKLVFYATVEIDGTEKKVITAEDEQDNILDEPPEEVTVPKPGVGTPAGAVVPSGPVDNQATEQSASRADLEPIPDSGEKAANEQEIKKFTDKQRLAIQTILVDYLTFLKKLGDTVLSKADLTAKGKSFGPKSKNSLDVCGLYVTKKAVLAVRKTGKVFDIKHPPEQPEAVTAPADQAPAETIPPGYTLIENVFTEKKQKIYRKQDNKLIFFDENKAEQPYVAPIKNKVAYYPNGNAIITTDSKPVYLSIDEKQLVVLDDLSKEYPWSSDSAKKTFREGLKDIEFILNVLKSIEKTKIEFKDAVKSLSILSSEDTSHKEDFSFKEIIVKNGDKTITYLLGVIELNIVKSMILNNDSDRINNLLTKRVYVYDYRTPKPLKEEYSISSVYDTAICQALLDYIVAEFGALNLLIYKHLEHYDVKGPLPEEIFLKSIPVLTPQVAEILLKQQEKFRETPAQSATAGQDAAKGTKTVAGDPAADAKKPTDAATPSGEPKKTPDISPAPATAAPNPIDIKASEAIKAGVSMETLTQYVSESNITIQELLNLDKWRKRDNSNFEFYVGVAKKSAGEDLTYSDGPDSNYILAALNKNENLPISQESNGTYIIEITATEKVSVAKTDAAYSKVDEVYKKRPKKELTESTLNDYLNNSSIKFDSFSFNNASITFYINNVSYVISNDSKLFEKTRNKYYVIKKNELISKLPSIEIKIKQMEQIANRTLTDQKQKALLALSNFRNDLNYIKSISKDEIIDKYIQMYDVTVPLIDPKIAWDVIIAQGSKRIFGG